MKHQVLLLIVLLASGSSGQDKPRHVGWIEFFGYAGIDLKKVRAALPVHEKDEFRAEVFAEKVERLGEAVKLLTGHAPSDITSICCDERGDWIIFIGLSGKAIRYNPRPGTTLRLPGKIVELYERFIKVNLEGVQKGSFGEDHTQGYALSEYPPLRSIQLEMRAYALSNEALLRDVLKSAADDQQRTVAAELLGYARQSKAQITALVDASRDSSGSVRNNVTRALIVLAKSRPKVAAQIPAEGFIELLLSGTWTDLNKASNLLDWITKSRSGKILAQLRRREVLDRLIEIARWRSHGAPAGYILGRIAGINENRLEQLIKTEKVEDIIRELEAKGLRESSELFTRPGRTASISAGMRPGVFVNIPAIRNPHN